MLLQTQKVEVPMADAMLDVSSMLKQNMPGRYWSGKWILLHPYQKRGSEIVALTWTDNNTYLLSCPRALGKRQPMGHRMTMLLSLSTMTWALGDSRSHNIGWAQQKLILNQKWYSHDWAQIIVECINKLQEEVGPMSSTTVSASALLPHLHCNR